MFAGGQTVGMSLKTIERVYGVTADSDLIDFLESPEAERIDAVRAGMTKVRPGGLLLLDDSDRPSYAGAYELLGDWRERRFTGVKDGWPEACETAIFRRPVEFGPPRSS